MKTIFIMLLCSIAVFAVEIHIDASAGRSTVSTFIYGKNNNLSDNAANPTSSADWQKYRDAGIKMFRENGGNNSTKYNWKRQLTSHPDWYNNVYDHNWDYAAQSLQEHIPGVKGMWAFQLIGWAAASKTHNFNDWDYNNSQWWEGVSNNWAGDGGPDAGDGDPELYLEPWDADETTGILDHWFNDLGLDKEMFTYWNMDNEPEVWCGTHDDVIPNDYPVENYMQSYFAVAKKARQVFPEIKLCGPVATNEWQWYNWNNDKISYDGKSYVWLEYFIKRVAEEQQASGMRLLDVLDIHFYPGESQAEDIVQLHRVFFDENYTYPGANGVKRAGSGGWTDNIRQEYIFQRCRDWLEKYMGADHGVGLSVSEIGIQGNDPNVTAIWYASTLGVFAEKGVEIFTPWTWKKGMWEVLHLTSRYNKTLAVGSTSDAEETVSAYSTMSADFDSLTIMLVNRDVSGSQTATINLANFNIEDRNYKVLQLSDLPENETFVSHTDNHLVEKSVTVSNGQFSIDLPKLSITSVLLSGQGYETSVKTQPVEYEFALSTRPNPFNPATTIHYAVSADGPVRIDLYDILGKHVRTLVNENITAGAYEFRLDGTELPSGMYLVRLHSARQILNKKIMLLK